MHVKSYAKINWALRVTGRRADGFHDLETLFQTISLHDELTFTPAERTSLTCDDPSIPTDDTNLILRAARLVDAAPVAIDLQKRIPAGGGLGGGSSNAAATLQALGGDRDDLPALALSLGSDVPFFLVAGSAYATGRGEVLTPLVPPPVTPLLLLFPEERVNTGEAFAMLRGFSEPLGIERFREIAIDPLAHEAHNDFEAPVFEKLPRLRQLKERLLEAGAAWAAMSGSGSTIVGAFREAATRDDAQERFGDVRAVAAETLSA